MKLNFTNLLFDDVYLVEFCRVFQFDRQIFCILFLSKTGNHFNCFSDLVHCFRSRSKNIFWGWKSWIWIHGKVFPALIMVCHMILKVTDVDDNVMLVILRDGDRFKMLVTESLCWRLFTLWWWLFQWIKSVLNILNLSPTYFVNIRHQHRFHQKNVLQVQCIGL